MIDSPEKAAAAGHAFRRADVDLLFLHVTTYALSSTVLPVVRRAKVPVIILNLSPGAAIDYATFNAMTRPRPHDRRVARVVPGLPGARNRQRLPALRHPLFPDHRHARRRPRGVERNRRVARCGSQSPTRMEHNRLGVMGHYYGGMLDVYSDLTLQCAIFGGHIEIVEVDELAALRGGVSPSEVERRVAHFLEAFDVQPDCSGEELERAARTSVALDPTASSATAWARWRTTTRAPEIRPTKTPSARSSWAPAFSLRAAFRSPANAKSRTRRP